MTNKLGMAGDINLDVAMEQFQKRKEENKGKQIDNGSLHAGSPMYFYCRHCGVHTETCGESYRHSPVQICDPCVVLHKHGLV